jgi:ribosomal protein S27E
MKIRCKKSGCEHEWEYKGKSKFYVTCPHCLRKLNIQKMKGGLKKDGNKT